MQPPIRQARMRKDVKDSVSWAAELDGIHSTRCRKRKTAGEGRIAPGLLP
jgi:hypothetical protein